MITQISDFGGNFRLPAGVPADLAQAAIFTSDSRLLRNFFDVRLGSYLSLNTNSVIIDNLREGKFGFMYQWRELGVPFCYANTNWGIMGFNIENPQISNELLLQIYALINDFEENFRELFQKVFKFTGNLVSVNGQTAIYELVDRERENQINWLENNIVLTNNNETEFYSITSIDKVNFRITVNNITSNFPDFIEFNHLYIKPSDRLKNINL